jgi:hypothetical protein
MNPTKASRDDEQYGAHIIVPQMLPRNFTTVAPGFGADEEAKIGKIRS